MPLSDPLRDGFFDGLRIPCSDEAVMGSMAEEEPPPSSPKSPSKNVLPETRETTSPDPLSKGHDGDVSNPLDVEDVPEEDLSGHQKETGSVPIPSKRANPESSGTVDPKDLLVAFDAMHARLESLGRPNGDETRPPSRN